MVDTFGREVRGEWRCPGEGDSLVREIPWAGNTFGRKYHGEGDTLEKEMPWEGDSLEGK